MSDVDHELQNVTIRAGQLRVKSPGKRGRCIVCGKDMKCQPVEDLAAAVKE